MAAEALTDDDWPEVGYRRGRRVRLRAVPSPLEKGESGFRLAPGEPVLVTGGARGITAAVAAELARRWRPTLLLVGSSAIPAGAEDSATAGLVNTAELKAALHGRLRRAGRDIGPAELEAAYRSLLNQRHARESLRAIRMAGSAVEYARADVRDAEALARALQDWRRRFGDPVGLVHGAGVIHDKLLRDKTPESFDRVLGTKLGGALNLARLLRPELLRFAAFFSSIAGRFGNEGQSDYAAANDGLNKLAVWLDRRWPARVVSVNWGPWSGLGMVSELEGHLGRRGLGMVSPDLGTAAFADELQYGRKGDVEVVIAGEPRAARRSAAALAASRGGDSMSRRRRPLDVAIVGMACRFPGADDLFAYWENLLAGRAAIRDVPADRWDASVHVDPASTEPGRVGGRRGGYLEAPIAFDPASFGIMPRTVEGGEPEQFLVLDAARSALADAGLLDRMPDGRRVEVVIGRGNYFNRGNLTRLQHGRVIEQTLGILRALHPEWGDEEIATIRDDLRSCLPPFEAATIPGQLTNATAGRVADRFDLAGASYVVDAASASALVALDLGARALASRRADLAIVGGVYLEADVDFPMVFSRLGALSRSGEARPFCEDADGMVPGEGAGVVVLKRLSDAERDGDRVYAIVKGVGFASDGKSSGLATPDARGHLRAIRKAYRASGVDPATVGLIEGHGLGVPAADRAELRALRAAFPASEGGSPRVLGAASALIGHAMPAAGMAGLIKAALALHHRMLPTSGVADRPHRLLRRSPLALNPASRPWIQGATAPRRAGVNAFGFAGINAHAVLEEHGASADRITPGAMVRWPTEAILLGAEDRAGLLDRVRRLADRLRGRSDAELKDLAYSLSADPGRVRLGLVVESVDDLIARLNAIAPRLADPSCNAIRDARGTYFWSRPLGRSGGLAFLFPGEGSQYPGMLADLCPHFPEVRALFDTADRLALRVRRHRASQLGPLRRHVGRLTTLGDGHGGQRRALVAVGPVSIAAPSWIEARGRGRPFERRIPRAGRGRRRAGRSRARGTIQ